MRLRIDCKKEGQLRFLNHLTVIVRLPLSLPSILDVLLFIFAMKFVSNTLFHLLSLVVWWGGGKTYFSNLGNVQVLNSFICRMYPNPELQFILFHELNNVL